MIILHKWKEKELGGVILGFIPQYLLNMRRSSVNRLLIAGKKGGEIQEGSATDIGEKDAPFVF